MVLHDARADADGLRLFAQNRELFCLWEAARGEAAVASRLRLPLKALKPFLPQLFILERSAQAQAYRCRLAGTGISALWGADMTGRDLREPAGAFEREVLARLFDAGFGLQQPFLARLRLRPARGEPVVAEMLGLPVRGADGNIQLLGAVQAERGLPKKNAALKAIQLTAVRILPTEHSAKVLAFPRAKQSLIDVSSNSKDFICTR